MLFYLMFFVLHNLKIMSPNRTKCQLVQESFWSLDGVKMLNKVTKYCQFWSEICRDWLKTADPGQV